MRWLLSGLAAFSFGAALMFEGRASGRSHPPVAMEQKIVNARTRADHEELASIYENHARTDQTAVKQHEGLAEQYRAPGYRGTGSILAQHCDGAARAYRQAALENAALAKVHRELVAQAGK